MNKKIILPLLLVFTLTMSLTAANGYVRYDGKVYNVETISGQINLLMAKHENYLKKVFNLRTFSDFEKSFFKNAGFLNNVNSENFFHTLQRRISTGNAPGRGSNMVIFYTSYSNINGKVMSVSYKYAANGRKLKLVKQTYENGNLLKAMYEYDINGRLLNVKEYRGNRLINNKKHKLIV